VDLARWLETGWGRSRGKWRILDGKIDSGLDHKFGAP
jgi:hypothetical protein